MDALERRRHGAQEPARPVWVPLLGVVLAGA